MKQTNDIFARTAGSLFIDIIKSLIVKLEVESIVDFIILQSDVILVGGIPFLQNQFV
jgi:hypothetical protein